MMDCNGCDTCLSYQGRDCVKGHDFSQIEAQSRKLMEDPAVLKILQAAAQIEANHYLQWNRLEELIGFCAQMGYRTLGIAMCVGLMQEAKILMDVLSRKFVVHSVCCKNCGINKDDYSLPHIQPERFEAGCNPVGQALVLNENRTELNIILGLCIGHDLLFNKFSAAPVTTFAVKDRVLAHNPLGALYSKYSLRKVLAGT